MANPVIMAPATMGDVTTVASLLAQNAGVNRKDFVRAMVDLGSMYMF